MSQSSSKSSSSSSTTYNTKTDNLNLQGVDGLAVAGVEGGSTVNVLDAGAVARAFDVSEKAILSFSELANRALGDSTKFASESLGAVQSTFDEAQSGGAQRVQTLAVAALAAVLVLGYLLRR